MREEEKKMRKKKAWRPVLLLVLLALLAMPAFAAEETDGQLYNGQKADYDDPEFVQLLESGYFDSVAYDGVDDGIAVASDSSHSHNQVFDGYEITKGVDVSRWNVPVKGANDTPVPIDWAKVKASGVDFVFIRCGYRSTSDGKLNKDIRFDLNMKGALEAGLEVGVYIYSQAVTEKEAREEANFALNMCENYDFDLPIVIDYEYYTSGRLLNAKLSKTQRTNICMAFCKVVEAANRPAMVYANKSMLVDDMYGAQITSAGYEVWLAQWTSSTSYSNPYTYWQYTDAGKVSGISGTVDMNYRYELPGTEIVGTSSTKSGIRLVWEEAELGDSYRLYRRDSGTTQWELLATVKGLDKVTYLDKTVTEGKSYEYAVRVCKGSTYSLFVQKGTSVTHEPVFSLSAAQIRAGGVQLAWEAQNGYSSYRLMRRLGTSGSWKVIAEIDDSSQTSFLDTSTDSMTSGKSYFYTICGVTAQGTEMPDEWGVELSWLSTPEMTTVAPYSKGMIVRWNKVSGAAGYYVYRKEGSSWTKIGTISKAGTLYYVDSSAITQEKSYTYTVRAYHADGVSWFDTDGTTGVQFPYPELKQVTTKNDGLELSWGAVKNAEQYVIYRKSGSGSWKEIARVTGDKTAYLDTKAESGVNLTYTVRAMRDGVPSWYDTTGVKGYYLAVPELNRVAANANGAGLSWKAVNGAVNYRVYRKGPTGGWKLIATTTKTSYTDTSSLSGDTNYTYTVRAYGKYQNKIVSSWYDTKGLIIHWLETPHLLSAENTNDGMQIKWKKSVGAETYLIYRKIPGGSWKQITTVKGAESYLDNTVQSGTTYYYTVRAADGTYTSWFESGISQLRLSSPVLKSTGRNQSGAAVSWNAVTGASQYYVYRRDSGSWKKIGATNKCYYTDTSSLTEGVKYTYTVRAVNGKTMSYYQAGLEYYALATPVLKSAANTETGVAVEWAEVFGADSYVLYRKVSGGSWKQIAEVRGVTYTDTAAVSGTAYLYTVRASKEGVLSWYDTKGLSVYYLQTPGNLEVSRTVNSALFRWDSVDGATNYRVYRKTTGGWEYLATTTDTSYKDTVIIQKTTGCTYTVRAYNGSKSSWYSTQGVYFSNPATPVMTGAENLQEGIQVTWEKIEGAECYDIYRKTVYGGWTLLDTVDEAEYLDESVQEGTSYSYTVKAVVKGISGWYDAEGVTCLRKAPEISPETSEEEEKTVPEEQDDTTELAS